jgi:Holliday junction resolvase
MQKIDLLTIERESHIRYIFRVIELKHPKSRTNINFAPEQLEYYINWAREDIGGHLLGARQFNIKPILLVLTKETNSISEDVVNKVRNLKEIALEPEIWEIDFEKVLFQIL